jgi:hypothetical protein
MVRNIEVMIRLQKALRSISKINHGCMKMALWAFYAGFRSGRKIMTHQADIIELKK